MCFIREGFNRLTPLRSRSIQALTRVVATFSTFSPRIRFSNPAACRRQMAGSDLTGRHGAGGVGGGQLGRGNVSPAAVSRLVVIILIIGLEWLPD